MMSDDGGRSTLVRRLVKPLLRPVRPLIRREVEARVALFTKHTPIEQIDENDVFIAGYPKSGNTWMQNLITGLVFGMDMRFVPDSLVQHLVPDSHAVRFYRRYLTPTFFKTHDLPRSEYRRVIYLVRDGRDAMVSYLHHLRAVNGTEQDFLKLVSTGEGLMPCRWHEHVEAWMGNPYGAKMIVVSYESLKRTPVDELQRICEFIELKRDRLLLESVAQTSSFQAMRTREKQFGWDDPNWPKDSPFVRRGEIGSFKDEMPLSVQKVFLTQSEQTLKRLGYVCEANVTVQGKVPPISPQDSHAVD
jgi:hypothetical protein